MQDQSLLFYGIAAINAVLCVLFLWRTVHFVTASPDCELQMRAGAITSYRGTRNWYGTPELDLEVGALFLRVHSGPWLPRVARLAHDHAQVQVGACISDSRRRLWELWYDGQPIVTRLEQQLHSRDVAKATFAMSLLFGLGAALFLGAEFRAA